MDKIKVGIIGTGFIGAVHVDALRRLGFVDIVALAEANQELAQKKAADFMIPRAYGNFPDLIHDPDVQVVHNCTPNNLHLSINTQIIEAGKHIFSEKPLGMNRDESQKMLELAKKHHIVHGVNFNYRMYPLVQDMKWKVQQGELGDIRIVHGSYLQDWLFYDTDYNWRIEPEISGKTRAIGDIGSHWCDLAQTITGLKISEVFADFSTVIPFRKKSQNTETFCENQDLAAYEEKEVQTEDWAGVLIHFENGAKGLFSVSEVCAGRKCYFNIEVNGSKKTYFWNQEEGDRMWVGHRSGPNAVIMRDPHQLNAGCRRYTFAPGGHPEGWLDTFKNNIQAFYTFLQEGKNIEQEKPDFATFYDGYDIACIVDAIAESHEKGIWVKVIR
ncbi:MAG: Gfo/Idh/MocA family oxidoreductase [Candidatus Atribacteria bacterium]|nr:Gfo/Idh/MocA family oxidoreductase [Candidatus Atribacteria bacterium]